MGRARATKSDSLLFVARADLVIVIPPGIIALSAAGGIVQAEFLFIEGLEERTAGGMCKRLIGKCTPASPRWLSPAPQVARKTSRSLIVCMLTELLAGCARDSWSDHKSQKNGCVTDNKELHAARNKSQCFKTLGGN